MPRALGEMTQIPEPLALGDAVTRALAGPHLEVDLARAHASARERLFGEPAPPIRIGRFIVLERIGQGAMGVVFAAYDPELDRKVAIKVLIERDNEAPEANRVAAEARAMARLSHPNVVHVYEVGQHNGRLFIAMEFIRGVSLRQWLTDPRSIADRLGACLQAGRGLAAAHAAGVTHRDFKPENIIVGDDGISRVLDFGLAKPTDLPSTDPTGASNSRPDTRAMVTASVHGTPGYIAPEVLRGAPASARSDRFSLAVTVWEALTGQLPFGGATTEARLSRTLRGRIPDDAPRPPARIERVLRRELEGTGFATVEELLAALARDPGPVRLRRAMILIAATTLASAYIAGGRWDREAAPEPAAPCGGATEIFDRTWAAADRAQATQTLAKLGEYGRVAAPRVAGAIERFASEWIEGHHDACMARERGELTDDLVDRRMTCLDRHRSALAALREVIDTAESGELAALTIAAEGLPRPSDCGELDRLEQQNAAIPADVKPLAHEIARANMAYRSGRTLTLRARVDELIAAAREAGHPSLLAKLLYLDGLMRIDAEDDTGAKISLLEATKVAFAAGEETLALQAWSNRVWVQAIAGDSDDFPSPESIEIIETLAERHSDDPMIVGIYANLGSVAQVFGRRAEARRVLERGIEIAGRIGDRTRSGLPYILSNVAICIDDPAERQRAHDRAVAVHTEVLGAEHPRTLKARFVRVASSEAGWSLTELQDIETALRRFHPDAAPILSEIDGARLEIADLLGEQTIAQGAARRLAERSDEVGAIYHALWSGDLERAAALAMAAIESAQVNADSPWYLRHSRGIFQLALGRVWAAANDPRAHDMVASALADLEAVMPNFLPGVVPREVAIARRELALVAEQRRTGGIGSRVR